MKNKFIILMFTMYLCACNDNTAIQSNESKPIDNTSDTKPVKAEKIKPTQNELAFDFSYPDLDANEVKLSDFRGKWVVVNYWATWCPPCRKEIPDFIKFKTLYADQVEILGIDNEDADIEIIRAFTEDFKINYPILIADVYNPTDFDKENTLGLPTTVFFNPKGEQVSKRVGPVHFKDLVEITGFDPVVDDAIDSKP